VLLMDEPFAAVDGQTRADLEDLVRTVGKASADAQARRLATLYGSKLALRAEVVLNETAVGP
jgi:ABC-type taurine transport system ATPase subunit